MPNSWADKGRQTRGPTSGELQERSPSRFEEMDPCLGASEVIEKMEFYVRDVR